MIQIINENGQALDLDSEYILTLEQNNFLFSDTDAFASDVNYPGQAPMTANNKSFIKNGHLLESSISVYQLPVTLFINDQRLLGDFVYSIKNDSIEFSFKVNMGTVYQYFTNTKLTKILSFTENTYFNKTPSEFIQIMEDSCTTPDLYPFVFCPIYNNKKSSEESKNSRPYLNAWNSSTNGFYIYSFMGMDITHEAPFFKLTYVLKKIAEYFGLSVDGSFFNDDYFKNIYIYTNRTVEYMQAPDLSFIVRRSIGHFGTYMPDITLQDLFLQLRDRLHIYISVDSSTRVLRVDTSKDILESSDVADLRDFISEVPEILALTREGLTVSLTPDPADESFKFENPLTGDTLSFPKFELVINDGVRDIEISVSTLRPHQSDSPLPILQSINNVVDPLLNWEPSDGPGFSLARSNKINNWPLRLFRYLGRSPSNNIPMSEPLDLDDRDIQWYRYINNIKEVVVEAYLPKQVLTNLDVKKKIAIRSEESYLAHGVVKKIEYGVGLDDPELFEVEITVYLLNMDQDTISQIKEVDPTKTED